MLRVSGLLSPQPSPGNSTASSTGLQYDSLDDSTSSDSTMGRTDQDYWGLLPPMLTHPGKVSPRDTGSQPSFLCMTVEGLPRKKE